MDPRVSGGVHITCHRLASKVFLICCACTRLDTPSVVSIPHVDRIFFAHSGFRKPSGFSDTSWGLTVPDSVLYLQCKVDPAHRLPPLPECSGSTSKSSGVPLLLFLLLPGTIPLCWWSLLFWVVG